MVEALISEHFRERLVCDIRAFDERQIRKSKRYLFLSISKIHTFTMSTGTLENISQQ